jgi:hypothetical protein
MFAHGHLVYSKKMGAMKERLREGGTSDTEVLLTKESH